MYIRRGGHANDRHQSDQTHWMPTTEPTVPEYTYYMFEGKRWGTGEATETPWCLMSFTSITSRECYDLQRSQRQR